MPLKFDHGKNKNKPRIKISPWLLPLPSPAEGELKYYQNDSVAFALSRDRSYLGMDPGTGKTIVGTMISSVVCDKTVYITPPFLVKNILAEYKKWTPWLSVDVYSEKKDAALLIEKDVLIVPDSLLQRKKLHVLLWLFGKFEDRTMIIDEAHRFKNKKSGRTKALLGRFERHSIGKGLFDLCARHVFMSGSPMPNRPMEMYTVLAKAAPETIDYIDEFSYGVHYCAGYKGRFGWDFTGASNVKKLGERVKSPTGPFMLRLRKSVLKLPPKIESVFLLDKKMGKELSSLDAAVRKKYSSAEDMIKAQLTVTAGKVGKDGVKELHLMSYRRMLGLEKARAIVPYLKSILTDTAEKFIVFIYHREAAESLMEALKVFRPLMITGKTPVGSRQAIVDTFQSDKSRRFIIASYIAMGVGFTCTAATREIFVEFDWVPGVNDQASDRAHRIGQTNSVLVQYVVYENSCDKSVIESNLKKRKAIALV